MPKNGKRFGVNKKSKRRKKAKQKQLTPCALVPRGEADMVAQLVDYDNQPVTYNVEEVLPGGSGRKSRRGPQSGVGTFFTTLASTLTAGLQK